MTDDQQNSDEQSYLFGPSAEKGEASIFMQLVPFLGSVMAISIAYVFNYNVDYFTLEIHDALGWSEMNDKWFEVTLVIFMCFAYLPAVVIPKLGPKLALLIAGLINLIGFSLCYIAVQCSPTAGTIGVSFS